LLEKMNSTPRGKNIDAPRKEPGDQEIKKLAQELIEGQNTMTIATALGNSPWAAPLYYTNLGFRLYFFSDPTSRHIQEAVKSEQAAAAIFFQPPTGSWKEIRGIQMSGKVKRLGPGLESLKALRAYLKKFPFTADFFEPGQNLNLASFFKRFSVRFYRFEPEVLYYRDNRIGFSFRKKVLI